MVNFAPVISDAGAGGTIPAATYQCKVSWATWSNLSGFHAWSNVSNNLVLPANHAIRVSVRGIRLGWDPSGKCIGRPTAFASDDIVEDPFMGGPVSGQVTVVLRDISQPNFYLQGTIQLTYTEVFGASGEYSIIRTAYTTSTIIDTTVNVTGRVPVKHILPYSDGKMVFFFAYNSLIWSTIDGAVSGSLRSEEQAAGVPICAYSPSPTPMTSCVVSRVPIYSDGRKPKKVWFEYGLFFPSKLIRFSQLGADPPGISTGAAVTPGRVDAGAGVLVGNYQWKVSFLYINSRLKGPFMGFNSAVNARQNVTETYLSESNPTLASVVINATAPGRQYTITLPSITSDYSNFYAVRVYRTKANGTVFYKQGDYTGVGTPITNITVDNSSDSALDVTTTPADDVGKDPCDLPPSRLCYLQEHQGRCWGVVGRAVSSLTDSLTANFRMANVVGSSIVRVSKFMLDAAPSEQSTVDHYPNVVDYTILCGSGDITALYSFRGQMYVFKDREIGIIVGENPGEWVYRILFSGIGAVPYSVCSFEGLIYFWNANHGGYAFDGSSYEWIGGDIWKTWQADNNSGYWVFGGSQDPDVSEIRWSMTTMLTDPAECQILPDNSNQDTVKGTWKEYVYSTQSKGWTIFTSTNEARRVMGRALIRDATLRRPYSDRGRMYFGTQDGRVLKDHQLQTDMGTAVVAFAEFAPFLGNAEMVKMFRKLFLLFTLAAPGVGNVTLKIRFQQTDAYTAIGDAPISSATHGDRVEVTDLPPSITDAGQTVAKDRGLQVRLESTVDTALVVKGLYLEYKDETSVRKEVRG